MPDDNDEIAAADRSRIGLGGDRAVRDWTEALGVTEDELRGAVDAVGNSADKVRDYLRLG